MWDANAFANSKWAKKTKKVKRINVLKWDTKPCMLSKVRVCLLQLCLTLTNKRGDILKEAKSGKMYKNENITINESSSFKCKKDASMWNGGKNKISLKCILPNTLSNHLEWHFGKPSEIRNYARTLTPLVKYMP